MKTLVSLIMVLLAVQENNANSFPYAMMDRQVFGMNFAYQSFPSMPYPGISSAVPTMDIPMDNQIANKLEPTVNLEDFKMLKESVERLEQKLEDLSKTLAANKSDNADKYEKIGDKFYYIENTTQANWFAAVSKCQELNGNLVSFDNKEEFELVTKQLTKSYWLGINDLGHDGQYSVALTGQQANYLNWHAGEPNSQNNTEHCVELKMKGSTYGMNDKPCHFELNFICEKNLAQ